MNDNVIVLENQINNEGIWNLHLMSNLEIEFDAARYCAPADAIVTQSRDIGVYHLRATWPMRAPLKIQCEGWPVPKMFVMWNMTGCASITEAVKSAAQRYEQEFGVRAEFAYLRSLPKGVEPGIEIDDVMVFDADWMVRKCVAVGWI